MARSQASIAWKPIGLFLVAAAVYLAGIDAYPLLDPDEGRYAEVAREMLESGDFITPRLNYVKYLEKPPLFYWAVAGSMAVFGREAWVVRLPAVVAGVLTLLVLHGLARRMYGPGAALLCVWVYLTSLLPLAMARLPIIDGMLTLLLCATWACAWQGLQSQRCRWFALAWACLALAVMAKGPVAIVLTGLLILGFIAATRRWSQLPALFWWPGPLAFCAIALPWHIAVTVRNPEFPYFYFVVQHFGRLASVEHAKPFWFFLAVLPVCMGFWGLPLFPALLAGWREGWAQVRTAWTQSAPRDVGGSGGPSATGEAALYLTISTLAVIGLFSVGRCKLVPYILPALPAASILVAAYLRDAVLRRPAARWYALLAVLYASLLAVALTLVARHDRNVPMAGPLLSMQAGLGAGALLLLLSAAMRRHLNAALGLCMLLLLPGLLQAVSLTATYRRTPVLMEHMPQPLPETVRIAELRTYDHSLGFYHRRRITMVDNLGELAFGASREPNAEFFATGEDRLREMARSGPLLVNLRTQDWPRIRSWGTFSLVGANSRNVMVGNDAFFAATGLQPLAPVDIRPPVLLLPRYADAGDDRRRPPAGGPPW